MASDCEAIRAEDKRRCGIEIGPIGPMLLADWYHDRTHFTFEFAENAEDALARRSAWQGCSLILTKTVLRVSHFGQPLAPSPEANPGRTPRCNDLAV
jgi:hypothetical protein